MKKKKKNNNMLVVAITILLILSIIIIITIKSNKKEENNNIIINQTVTNSQDEETSEEIQTDEIKTLSETKRMKRYIGIFFDNIEAGNYETEYNKLNEEFKNNYFPTLNSFKEYVDKYFNTKYLGVTYDNVERLGNEKTGNMYVVWITTANLYMKKLSEDEELEATNFVIVEHDYNNYELSFSVNEE
jgi:hypothetical protein